MKLLPREKHILQIMLDGEGMMYAKEIADKLKVSRRTVLRELKNIGANLIEFNISLEKRQGQGIWLKGSQGDKEKLRKLLEKTDVVDYTDKELRRKHIICELLKSEEPQKLYYFSRTMDVSDGTVSSDLDGVSQWLSDAGVQLIRKHGYGIHLQGTEKDIRRAIKKLFAEEISNEELKSLLKDNKDIYKDRGIYSLIKPEMLITVAIVLESMRSERLKLMTDISYLSLIVHISAAITRILKGNKIDDDLEDNIEELKVEEDFQLAEEIIYSLEREFSIKLSKVEFEYIFMEIRGSKLQQPKEDLNINLDLSSGKILTLVDLMIDAFDNENAYSLKYDQDFVTALICHLQPTIFRLNRDMMIFNPMLKEIKSHYREYFEKSRRAAKILEDFLGVSVNDHEIGYLTIHFGAALERLNSSRAVDRAVSIGIVCESGIGIARFMQAKLESYLKKDANIYAFAREDIDQEVKERIDFFISSINLHELQIDYVHVTPLINLEDYRKIEKKVKAYAKSPKKHRDTRANRNIEEINYIAMEMDIILNQFSVTKVNKDISFNRLLDYICKRVGDNEDKASIIYRDIQARERLLTQIFEKERFALLHCRTKGVVNSSFYVFNPDKGEYFTDSYMKQIRSVIVMLMPENQHSNLSMKLLGTISSFLISDISFLNNIFNGNEEAIKMQLGDVLSDNFEKFLNQ